MLSTFFIPCAITIVAQTPQLLHLVTRFAPAIPLVPMLSPVSINIFATNKPPRPFVPPALFSGSLGRVNPRIFGFVGCKSSRTWWTPVRCFERQFPHDHGHD